jgi:hypothetical protein
VLGLLNVDLAMHHTSAAVSALRERDRYAEDPRPLTVQSASEVRVANPYTAATVAAAGFWTDAAAYVADNGLSAASLTKTAL